VFDDGECDCDHNVEDCTGTCGGAAEETTFYLDSDGDGLGAGNGYTLCNGFDLIGWVANNDDSDDGCYSNYHDCFGICDGISVEDDCGVCDGGNADIDCAGVCNGNNLEDECGICDNDPNNNCVQDCTGEWGGVAVDDECDVCNGDGSSCNQPIAYNSNVQVEEDESIDFDLIAEDPNQDVLLATVVSGPSNGDLNISNLSVTYTPENNFFGLDDFTFTVAELEVHSRSVTVNVKSSKPKKLFSGVYVTLRFEILRSPFEGPETTVARRTS
jgi:hypothetical protein